MRLLGIWEIFITESENREYRKGEREKEGKQNNKGVGSGLV